MKLSQIISRAATVCPQDFSFAETSFAPNEAMRKAAERGLEDRRQYGRGGTLVGVARARDIANGSNLSLDTVKRMYSFFSRHSAFKNKHSVKEGDGGPTAAKVAWDLWGGDPGEAWASSLKKKLEAEGRW